jgi:hypothetical protein
MKKVLVIEEGFFVRMFVINVLQGLGFWVADKPNFEKAKSLLKDFYFSAVFSGSEEENEELKDFVFSKSPDAKFFPLNCNVGGKEDLEKLQKDIKKKCKNIK